MARAETHSVRLLSAPEQGATADTQHRRSVELTLAAATVALIFVLAFVVPQPLWNGQPGRPPAQPSQADGGVGLAGALLALAYALAWTLPFRPYAHAVRLAHAVPTRLLLLLTAALAAVALLIFPAFGSDLFVYVDYERLWTVYSENPLLTAPASHQGDWAFQFIWLPFQPSPYGPLWAILTWPIAQLAGTSIAAQVAGYKLLMLAAYATCCALIWTAFAEPARRARALVLFAWSPLVLFDTLGKAHNDVLLAVAALAAIRLGRGAGPLAAVAGGLVKASGLALLPSTLLWHLRQRQWRQLGIGLAGAIALSLAAYAPFWRGPETLLPVLAQTSRVVWSPGSLLIALGVDQTTVRILLGVAWLSVCWLVLRRCSELAASACLVLLATLLLLTTAFFAHYLVPVVALSAVSSSRRLQVLVTALSVGAMGAYAIELFNLAFGPGWIGSPAYQLSGSLVLLAPAAIALWLLRKTDTEPANHSYG